MKTLKIYCAGGDVFLPETERNRVFQSMKTLAATANTSLKHANIQIELLIPIDNTIELLPQDSIKNKRANALKIRLANEEMIRSCDAVFANLSPFRGNEPDCGTSYECGFAQALGKTTLVYSDNHADQTEKYRHFNFSQSAEDARFTYTEIEDFALPFNLMMYDDRYPIFHSFEECLSFYLSKPSET